jgi:hypothetical protein
MDLIQRNRQYVLIVGDSNSGEALEITDLQVTFDISKSTDNKKKTNSAAIEIYNLSREQIKLLDTDYPAAVFSAGYLDTGGPKRLFGGQVTHVSTRKSGTDLVTQLQLGAGYTELNHQILSELVAPGQTVKDVAEAIRKNLPGVSRGVYNGTNLNNEIIYGYPLMGTPKEMLDELAEKYQLDTQIDDDVLYVHNNDRAATENFQQAYVISQYTGLVDTAYRVSGDRRRSAKDKAKKPGIQMRILLNPDIKAGDIIYLEDTLITGWMKVDSLRHYGGWRSPTWYTDIKASSLEKVVQKGAGS